MLGLKKMLRLIKFGGRKKPSKQGRADMTDDGAPMVYGDTEVRVVPFGTVQSSVVLYFGTKAFDIESSGSELRLIKGTTAYTRYLNSVFSDKPYGT